MLKILVQTVCSIALALSISSAKNIPMVQEIDLYIPCKDFSVIEFPFNIKGYSFTPFVYKESKKKANTDAMEAKTYYKSPTLKTNLNNIRKKASSKVTTKVKQKQISKKGPIDIGKGKNFFRLYPKKYGKTTLLVWGYEKYPMMINLHIIKDKTKVDKLISFKDNKSRLEEASTFESAYHDRVVIKLTRDLYLKKLPNGYKLESMNREYVSPILHVELKLRMKGKRYAGEEYLLTNISNKTIVLDSEMFENKGIYGVTFVNNVLKPNSSTRVFIVRRRGDV